MFSSTDDTLASLEEVGYFTTREIANTIYLAGELNRPILLAGPAGAGKTEMALAINRATGMRLIRLQCYEGLTDKEAIGSFSDELRQLYVRFHDGTFDDAYAAHYVIPKELVHALITQESGWDPRAISSKGAMGLMQLMPATAADYGVRDPFDISENLSGGVRYLADLMQQFDGDFRLVLAAYYRGSRPILRSGLHYSGADVYAYVTSVRRLYFAELAHHKTPANLAPGGD